MKLTIVEFAKTSSVEAAARKFGVHPKSVRDWRSKQLQLEQTGNLKGGKKLKRLQGAGKKLCSPELDNVLIQWIQTERQKSLRVSRRMIREKAKSLFPTLTESVVDFKASVGWLTKFLKRNGLTLRKRTTVAQKDPDKLHELLVNFIMYSSKVRDECKIRATDIVAMDETSLWFDMIGNTTVDVVGSKSVPLKSTGNEKAHATVVLAAKGDGTKLKPYIVFKNAKREVKAMENLKGAVVVSSINGWMNDNLTADWLTRIFGKISFATRMLVWDSYKCHISESTKNVMKEFKTKSVVIPGGCTKYIQAPDVSWNKPFKAHLAESYDKWLSGNDNKTYTKGGNLKAPARSLLVDWVKMAWGSLSTELIIKSFRTCGLTIKTDGSEDCEIHCLKKDQPCSSAKTLLDIARVEKNFDEIEISECLEEEEDNEIVVHYGDESEEEDSEGNESSE